MNLLSLFSFAKATRRTPPTFRPTLEILEARTTPSLIASQILGHLFPTSTVAVVPPAGGLVGDSTGPQTITLTDTISGAPTGGTVTFTIAGFAPITVPVVHGVAATPFTIPANTPPGTFAVVAVFSGGGGSGSSTGSTTFIAMGTVATVSCQNDPFLGTAAPFAVLGSSAVTNTGATTIVGNVGIYPGTSITGESSISITGTYHQTDAVAEQARNDVITAYNALAGDAVTDNLTGHNLGGLTLTPGVYKFASSAQLTGTLILNYEGNPNAVFVFQIGTTLTTASGSKVTVENDPFTGMAPNVYWQVGSSATLGTTTLFIGNILADQSITLDTGAQIHCGRALAIHGAVSLDNNTVSNL